jgi:vacuolar-type H+-ATPase catalytic subunit A/Vma1
MSKNIGKKSQTTYVHIGMWIDDLRDRKIKWKFARPSIDIGDNCNCGQMFVQAKLHKTIKKHYLGCYHNTTVFICECTDT